MKIFILGSCVSRDAFNFCEIGEFKIVEYIARSSLASIFAEVPFEDKFSCLLNSKFQQRLVDMDINKRAVAILDNSEFDLLLVDLIDERFNLAESAPGRVCTVSSEFLGTGALKELPNLKIINSGSDVFFKYWENGFLSLIDLIEKNNKIEKFKINKVYWLREMENGEVYKNSNIDKANETLDKMYLFIEKRLGKNIFFTYDSNEMRGAINHQWGPAPFHYVNDFYLSTISKIRSIAARDVLNNSDS